MKTKILSDALKISNNITIPDYVLKHRKVLDLDLDEFILLIYLINQKDNIMFDINKLSSKLYMENNKVLELISSLNEKNYITLEMKKTNGVIEEYISTELFFNKIETILLSDEEEVLSDDIYSIFEVEFGRTLSPTETQIIGNWIESSISEELIKEALKEAVLSGVHNMRYIDKILHEWTKKGYKEASDIKRKPEKEEKIEEIYDYDWLNE